MNKLLVRLRASLKKIFSPGTAYSVASPATRLRNQSAQVGGMGERELQLRMEMLVGKALETKSTQVFETSQALAGLSLTEQDRFMQAATRLQQKNEDLAYCFCCHGIHGLKTLRGNEWEKWLEAIEQTLHRSNARTACAFLKDIQAYLASIALPAHAVSLENILPLLEKLLIAFSGRRLTVQAGQEVYSNTENIYLPKTCVQFDNAEDNFKLYKIWVAYLWAQNQFQTWNFNHQKLLYDYGSTSDKAWQLFQILENLRLDYLLEQALPGIARLIKKTGNQASLLPEHPLWHQAQAKLNRANATAEDSLALVQGLLQAPLPQTTLYCGVLKPEETLQTIHARINKDRDSLRQALTEYLKELKDSPQKSLAIESTRGPTLEFEFHLKRGDETVEVTPEIQEVLESIAQDLGEIPQTYLEDIWSPAPEQTHADEPPQQKSAAQDAYLMKLPEWDYSVNHYRSDWCSVYAKETTGGDTQMIEATRNKYKHTIKRLKQTFEALREKNVRLWQQPDGDEIDLDAAITSIVDIQSGVSLEQSIYLHNKKEARSVAVSFLVDVSSSTSGWVNQLEKEALILLCESLEVLGDRYAIYGFSSQSRKRCEFQFIKLFQESYNAEVRKRIAGLTPSSYTRLGAAIRFLTKDLLTTEAKTHLLIVLSDGRPEDMDGYLGRYGIEDTRRALIEAANCGIHCYCVTIETKNNDYLAYMYGKTKYAIVNHVEQLPFRISDIYQRITR